MKSVGPGRKFADHELVQYLESHLAYDPLVRDQALAQLVYVPTVTHDNFRTQGPISTLLDDGRIFEGVTGPRRFDPAIDRIMLCGSMAMIRDFFRALLQARFRRRFECETWAFRH